MRPWIRRSPLSTLLSTGVALAVLCVILPTHADHPCTSPLLLDLNDAGRIRTVSVDDGVSFDINSDGTLERIGWTHEDGEEGFLSGLRLQSEPSSGRWAGSSSAIPLLYPKAVEPRTASKRSRSTTGRK